MKTWRWVLCALVLSRLPLCAAQPLVIHEWGTMTALEDENGSPVPGINADDEPVPAFVHQVAPGLLVGPDYAPLAKGVPRLHPDVTVRLETPVMYIHAPPGFSGPLDISVKFLKGWLTEFYPNAHAIAPGIDPTTGKVGHISGDGSLDWKDLAVGVDKPGPTTDAHVWLAPRAVKADAIESQSGEAERFLFYRGVGTADPLLHLIRNPATDTLHAATTGHPAFPFWLLDVRPGGAAAMQFVDAGHDSRAFTASDYSAAGVMNLRTALKSGLTNQGLNPDEADALLNTWQVSYFKDPGLRAFFFWPRPDIDRVLPLTVTPQADIARVMIGRIELITPAVRKTIQQIAAEEQSNLTAAINDYTSLGRFREAILLSEPVPEPNSPLQTFMQRMTVTYYQLDKPPIEAASSSR